MSCKNCQVTITSVSGTPEKYDLRKVNPDGSTGEPYTIVGSGLPAIDYELTELPWVIYVGSSNDPHWIRDNGGVNADSGTWITGDGQTVTVRVQNHDDPSCYYDVEYSCVVTTTTVTTSTSTSTTTSTSTSTTSTSSTSTSSTSTSTSSTSTTTTSTTTTSTSTTSTSTTTTSTSTTSTSSTSTSTSTSSTSTTSTSTSTTSSTSTTTSTTSTSTTTTGAAADCCSEYDNTIATHGYQTQSHAAGAKDWLGGNIKVDGVNGSGAAEPGETTDAGGTWTTPSGNYEQVPVAFLKTLKFGHGQFWGSGAPGADHTTHSAYAPSGGGKFCFDDLDSANVTGQTIKIRLRDPSSTYTWLGSTVDAYNDPYGSELTGMPMVVTAPQGEVTISRGVKSTGCPCVYVNPDGDCYTGDLQDATSGNAYTIDLVKQ